MLPASLFPGGAPVIWEILGATTWHGPLSPLAANHGGDSLHGQPATMGWGGQNDGHGPDPEIEDSEPASHHGRASPPAGHRHGKTEILFLYLQTAPFASSKFQRKLTILAR